MTWVFKQLKHEVLRVFKRILKWPLIDIGYGAQRITMCVHMFTWNTIEIWNIFNIILLKYWINCYLIIISETLSVSLSSSWISLFFTRKFAKLCLHFFCCLENLERFLLPKHQLFIIIFHHKKTQSEVPKLIWCTDETYTNPIPKTYVVHVKLRPHLTNVWENSRTFYVQYNERLFIVQLFVVWLPTVYVSAFSNNLTIFIYWWDMIHIIL
jgi:hypothetical protein